jgi:DNA-binding transcriptional LysR family regulator
MDLHQLRIFVTVAAEQSVTRAAKRLFMTPPSVSSHIKALESELGVQLFVRTSRGMEITAQGRILEAKAEQTIRAAQDVVHAATAMQGHLTGSIAFGMNATPHLLRIASITVQMRTKYPDIAITFVQSASGKILDALHDRTLDIGYVFGPIPEATLVAHRVCTVELVVAVPKQWEQLVQHAGWEELATLPWLTSDSYCPFQDLVDTLFAHKHLDYQRVIQTNDEVTKLALVGAGVGLALLEHSEVQDAAREGQLVVWGTEPIPCDLSLAYAAERAHDPLVKAVAFEVLQVWNQVLEAV